MQYMLLIYGNQASWDDRSDEERGQMMQAYGDFTQELRDSGTMIAGDALEPTQTATTVRVQNDETLTTDGPFAETKEQLLGFYVVDCAGEDAAIESARDLRRANPSAVYEIRPISLYLPGVPFPVTEATAGDDQAGISGEVRTA